MTSAPQPPPNEPPPGGHGGPAGAAPGHGPQSPPVGAPPPGGPASEPRSQTGGLARAQASTGRRGLVRPRRGRLLAGVLAGLGRRFGISPWAARALFLLSLLLPGPQFIAYAVLWIVMPNES